MVGVILGENDERAGVIEFINKKGREDVKNYDIQRFKAMRNFIGKIYLFVTFYFRQLC